MNPFRRDILGQASPSADTHAGLWLDKYLLDDENESKKTLVKVITDTITIPAAYKQFFERWQKALEDQGAQSKKAKTLGRLAVNLGAEGVLETSIALHRTYGVPYIPGSALKGLAAHYAIQYQDKQSWGRESEAFRILFGDTENAGYVVFYDALYVPGSGKSGKSLWKDVITVHHSEYYQGSQPPADWDNPTPIPFITANGDFLIAISGPKEWVDVAFRLLAFALKREGVGAKTSSGYGRMEVEGFHQVSDSASQTPLLPGIIKKEVPKGVTWTKGKTTADGKKVYALIMPDNQIKFSQENVLPKGYTAGGNKDVEFYLEKLPDGSDRIWVKKPYTFTD